MTDQQKALNTIAPSDILTALDLPPNTTIGMVFFQVIQQLEQRTESESPTVSANDEQLAGILNFLRPFMLPEQREILTKRGLLPPPTGFTPWTKEQRAAQSQANSELHAKLFEGAAAEPLNLFPLNDLMNATVMRAERTPGVSEAVREAIGNLASALDAEKRRLN